VKNLATWSRVRSVCGVETRSLYTRCAFAWPGRVRDAGVQASDALGLDARPAFFLGHDTTLSGSFGLAPRPWPRPDT
jgi:hypothetical protein